MKTQGHKGHLREWKAMSDWHLLDGVNRTIKPGSWCGSKYSAQSRTWNGSVTMLLGHSELDIGLRGTYDRIHEQIL